MSDISKRSLQSALPNSVPYSFIINPKVCYLFIPVFQPNMIYTTQMARP